MAEYSVPEDFVKLIDSMRWKAIDEEGYLKIEKELLVFTKFPRVIMDYIHSDYPSESVAELCLRWQAEWPKLDRKQLIVLVEKIMKAEGSEAEGDIDLCIFDANCNHPSGSDLIFYPDDVLGTDDPTVEQIVEAAMTGKSPE